MNDRKVERSTQVDHLDEAFIENILALSEADIESELRELGFDTEEVPDRMAAAIARGVVRERKSAFAQAKTSLANVKIEMARARSASPSSAAVSQFHRIRAQRQEAGDPMMIAARNGDVLSARDDRGLLEDLDDLRKLGGEPDPA